MYILKNALKSITRNKARNILVGIVVLVIAVSSCIALSIREAAETAKKSTLDSLSITGQISFNRSSAMSEMKEQGEMNMDNLKKDALTLEDYMLYTGALSEGDSYYYTLSTSFNAAGTTLAYGNEEETNETTTDEASETENMKGGMMPDMGKEGSMESQGDFSVTGYSSYESIMSLFGTDGTCTISDGQMFDETSEDLTCVISDELAMYNSLAVGDKITISNPENETETYEISIVGIYTNTVSDEGNGMFARSEPANNIYMGYNALSVITAQSEALGSTAENDSGETVSTSLKNQVNFTYVFSEADHYYTFEKEVYNLGLSDEYTVSSSDLSAYESSLTPLETLSEMAGWFFLVVLVVGGVVLIVLNIFNLRERKYEVGVLTAIGMKKHKVGAQFIIELFIVTFAAIIIGTAAGAAASVPVTNTLLASQTKSSEQTDEEISENFGFPGGEMGMGEQKQDKGQNAGMMGEKPGQEGRSAAVSYITSVSSATNLAVVLKLVLVGVLLTLISSFAALITIMRYEPLRILSSRS